VFFRDEIAKNNKKLAEEKLREQKRKEEMEGLIRALKDSDEGVRERAAKALGKIRDKRAVEPLIEALKDSEWSVRREAAKALGEIGDGRAVEPLIKALDAADASVQIEAAEALHKIGNERADEALKHKRVVERLIRAFKDSDKYVRGNAAKALKKIALNAINEAQSLLQQAKKLGINTKNEEEKLNNAKLKLDGKGFSKAAKLANECKNSLEREISEYRQAERSAKQSLDLAYSKIKEAENLGINVSDAKDLHKKAISKFDNRAYEKAIEYAEKCKKAAEDEIRKYNHAKEQIEASKDIVKGIKKLVSIPKAEELIEKAESALKVGNYNSAVKFAKEAEGEALRVKKAYETYKETSEFISSIESEIDEIRSSGVKITTLIPLNHREQNDGRKPSFLRVEQELKE